MSTAPPSVLTMPEHQPIVYAPHERPDVEVLVNGEWQPGEVRMVWWDNAGVMHHNVQYRPAGTDTRRIETFTDDQVREDTVDRSRGRR